MDTIVTYILEGLVPQNDKYDAYDFFVVANILLGSF